LFHIESEVTSAPFCVSSCLFNHPVVSVNRLEQRYTSQAPGAVATKFFFTVSTDIYGSSVRDFLYVTLLGPNFEVGARFPWCVHSWFSDPYLQDKGQLLTLNWEDVSDVTAGFW